MNTGQALVPKRAASNGNGTAVSAPVNTPPARKPSPAPEPLTDESVARILEGRGLRGWLRAARVGRVLGLFTLYIFLDTYDIRAGFNRRMVERLRVEAKT